MFLIAEAGLSGIIGMMWGCENTEHRWSLLVCASLRWQGADLVSPRRSHHFLWGNISRLFLLGFIFR